MLSLIAHTPSVNTLKLRDALIRGVESQLDTDNPLTDISLNLKTAFDATASDILGARVVLLFTPENFGYMSGAMKDFFDRTFYTLLDKTGALPYALVIRAGTDGTGTKRAVEAICSGLSWKPIQPALVCQGDYQTGFEKDCETLGAEIAAGLCLGIY